MRTMANPVPAIKMSRKGDDKTAESTSSAAVAPVSAAMLVVALASIAVLDVKGEALLLVVKKVSSAIDERGGSKRKHVSRK